MTPLSSAKFILCISSAKKKIQRMIEEMKREPIIAKRFMS